MTPADLAACSNLCGETKYAIRMGAVWMRHD
jgi:hypothetical protein